MSSFVIVVARLKSCNSSFCFYRSEGGGGLRDSMTAALRRELGENVSRTGRKGLEVRTGRI